MVWQDHKLLKPAVKIDVKTQWFIIFEVTLISRDTDNDQLTCVVEEGGNECAVFKECVAGGYVFKVALLKQRILKYHGLHLQVHEPTKTNKTIVR